MPRQSVLTGPVVLALVIAALAWATVALGTSVARDGTTSRQSATDRYGRSAAAVSPGEAVERTPLGLSGTRPSAASAAEAVAAVPTPAGVVEGVVAGTPTPVPEPE